MKHYQSVFPCAVLLTLGLFATGAKAQSIVNGSFEADNWSASPGYQLNLASAGLTGWTVGDVLHSGEYPWGLNDSNRFGAGPAPDGKQWVVLGMSGSSGTEYIEQTVSGLTSGTQYALSFEISSEGYLNGYGAGNAQLNVSAPAGSLSASQIFVAPDSIATYWDTWNTFTYNFVASGTSATVRFTDAGPIGNGLDLGLDNVSIKGNSSQTPEQGSVALLLSAGIGSGILLRRRNRK